VDGDAQTAAAGIGAQQPPPSVVLGAQMFNRDTAEIDAAQKQAAAAKKPIIEKTLKDVATEQERFDKMAADYKPVEQTKPPPPPENDPLKGFASAASVFALIASAFTHTPAINAMNGMAAAINATKANDWKAYEEGYKQWKENTELAIKNHELQANDMKLALETMQTELSTGMAKADAAAASANDVVAAKLLNEHRLEDYGKLMDERARTALAMKEYALKVDEYAASQTPVKFAARGLTQAQAALQQARTPEQRQQAQAAVDQAQQKYLDARRQEIEATQTPEQRTFTDQVTANMDTGMTRAAAELKAERDITAAKTVVRDKLETLLDQDGKPVTKRSNADGSVTYFDASGNVTYPTSLTKPGTSEAPNVAARKDSAEAETERYHAALESILNNRLLTQQAKDERVSEENERHHKAIEATHPDMQSEANVRAIAGNPDSWKDGKLTDEAFRAIAANDYKAAIELRKSGLEKSYAPTTYRLKDGSNVTAIVSADGTAREVGTNRVVNLEGAVKGGPETAAQNKERNVETLANAQIERMNQSRKDANESPLTDEEKAQASLDARWIIEGDEAAAKAKAMGQAKQALQPKKLTLNDNAVDFEAKQLLLTGQMPAMGLASGDARMQIINRAGDLAAEQGHTVEDYIAGRAEWKADVSSVGQITKIADAVQGFENTALANMQTAERLMDKGAGTSLGPVVNRWLQAGKQATGDPDVAAFNTAMGTVSSEYGKIISGGSASIASTPEGAREEAAEWLNKLQSPEAIRAQFAVARQDMANRKDSLFKQRDAITHRIRNEQLSDPQTATQTTTPSVAPTDNATGTSKSGRPIIFRNGQWEYQ
jgi:hypothetical protein